MIYIFCFNDKEHHEEVDLKDKIRTIRYIAQELVLSSGITTPRNNPQKIKVDVYRYYIESGEQKKVFYQSYEVDPYLERMEKKEYQSTLDKMLDEIPEEFHTFVIQRSYEEGHAFGFEEIINIASDIISNLKPCIKEYRINLLR